MDIVKYTKRRPIEIFKDKRILIVGAHPDDI